MITKSHILLLLLFIVSLAGISFSADEITVPVVVNIIDSSDSSKVDAAIKKANEILAKANIKLEVVKTNKNVAVGDGNGNLGEGNGEHDKALEQGEKELENTCGAGKGLKITVADDVWTEDPNTVGWAIHRDPVIFVEGGESDPNKLGRTIAHEAAHSLTLDYDLYDGNDPNRLMWGYDDGKGNLTPAEVNEIRKTAEQRGREKYVMPKVLPGRAVAIPGDMEIRINGYGAVVDSFFDVFCPVPDFNTHNPLFRYADIKEVTMFWPRPLDTGLTDPFESMIDFKVRLGGTWPIDSFFDVFLQILINKDSDPEHDGIITMHVHGDGGVVMHDAFYQNLETGLTDPFELLVQTNDKFDGAHGAIPANQSLEIFIPASEIFGPGSDPFDNPVVCVATLMANDGRLSGPLMDGTEGFEFALEKPFDEPRISFFEPYTAEGGIAKIAVCGSDFPAGMPVEVLLNDNVVGVAMAKPDGTVMAVVNKPMTEASNLWQLRSQMFDPAANSITYTTATGYLMNCAGDAIEGDIDGDCDVDFLDLAKLAENWLKGTVH